MFVSEEYLRLIDELYRLKRVEAISLVQYLLIQPNKVVFLLRKKYEEEKGKFKIMYDIPLQRMS